MSQGTHSSSSKSQENIRVVVRCRPMSESEMRYHVNIVKIDGTRGNITLLNTKTASENKREFTFDSVYDWNSKQIDVYLETIHPIVESVLQGYNGTIFAYGQTGTGKTYTMQGTPSDPEMRGVIPNCFDFIFSHISKSENLQFLVRASYLEIYQDEVRDLLSKDQKKRLELRERPDTGVYVQDLSSFVTKSVKEIVHVMNVGNQNRSVGRTDMNEHSSRSHAIFVITIECSEMDTVGESHIRVGKLNLVDLAGSERQAKTHSTGEQFKEATKINLSLSALGNVISALVDGNSTHIPYRDSKLTRLLQDSLGGNSKTVMIATVGPASYNFEESLLTLRYANRAKHIKNKPRINEDPKDALLREFQDELSRLKSLLDKKKKSFGKKGVKEGERNSEEESTDDKKDRETYLKERRSRLEAEKAALLQNTEMVEEEKDKLVQDVQSKMEEVKKEQKNRDNLAAKIKAMESKLLAGGKTISVHTAEQEKALAERRHEIAAQKAREQEIRQKLEANKESASEIKETFDNLHEEVESKTRKLKKLYNQLQLTKVEIEDYGFEQVRRKQDLLSAQELLMKEIKFKTLVLDNFVPPDYRDHLCSRAEYDEEKEEWGLQGITHGYTKENMAPEPGSYYGFIRPITNFAREQAKKTNNPRFKVCNVLQLELDMPARTTKDYEVPKVPPAVKAVMDEVVKEMEEPLTIDVSEMEKKVEKIDFFKLSKTKKVNPQKTPKPDKEALYPTTRGLISTPVRFV